MAYFVSCLTSMRNLWQVSYVTVVPKVCKLPLGFYKSTQNSACWVFCCFAFVFLFVWVGFCLVGCFDLVWVFFP